MMRRVYLLVISLVLLFSMATVAMGAGVLGETDLMYTPTTSVLNPNNLGIAVNFREGDYSFFNFDFGLVENLELGLAAYNNPHETNLSVRGKYLLLRERGDYPGLAIGIEDIGQDDISPYIVLSKTLGDIGINGYLGAGGGSFDGIFGGIEKTFRLNGSRSGSELSQIDLFLEADSHGLNIGTKLGLGSQTKINFGLDDMENWVVGVTFLLK